MEFTLDWDSIIVAIIGSSVIAAMITHYSEKAIQEKAFTNQFRERLIESRLLVLEDIGWILEQLRTQIHVPPQQARDNDPSGRILSQSKLRHGYSYHAVFADEKELEALSERIEKVLEKELWMDYNTYLEVLTLSRRLTESMLSGNPVSFAVDKFRLIEEERMTLQIQVAESLLSVAKDKDFFEEKIVRTTKRRDDFVASDPH